MAKSPGKTAQQTVKGAGQKASQAVKQTQKQAKKTVAGGAPIPRKTIRCRSLLAAPAAAGRDSAPTCQRSA